MDDKLIRFFNKINFDEIDDFEGVKVSKVVINKQKESWIVYLQSDKVVNPEAMIKLINKAKNGIENVNTIDIKTDYSNILDEDIIKYFKYFLDQKVIDNVSDVYKDVRASEVLTALQVARDLGIHRQPLQVNMSVDALDSFLAYKVENSEEEIVKNVVEHARDMSQQVDRREYKARQGFH